MIKKFLALATALALVLTLTACSGNLKGFRDAVTALSEEKNIEMSAALTIKDNAADEVLYAFGATVSATENGSAQITVTQPGAGTLLNVIVEGDTIYIGKEVVGLLSFLMGADGYKLEETLFGDAKYLSLTLDDINELAGADYSEYDEAGVTEQAQKLIDAVTEFFTANGGKLFKDDLVEKNGTAYTLTLNNETTLEIIKNFAEVLRSDYASILPIIELLKELPGAEALELPTQAEINALLDELLPGLDGIFGDFEFTAAYTIDGLNEQIVFSGSDGTDDATMTLDVTNKRIDKDTKFYDGGASRSLLEVIGELYPEPEPEPYVPSEPSSWAAKGIQKAAALDLLPYSFTDEFRANTTREEFAYAAVWFAGSYYEYSGKNFFETIDFETIDYDAFSDIGDTNYYTFILIAKELGIVSGYGDKFRPDEVITREQAAQIVKNLAKVIGRPLEAAAPTFTDSDKISSGAKAAVGALQNAKIVSGYGDGTYGPADAVTHEQTVIILLKLWEHLEA
ncbi:hypothetical protein FACS18949_11440 [Clostridia bacterium]|nr:hypothetical protein FACS18949_11440 [Clostridia bacterium]